MSDLEFDEQLLALFRMTKRLILGIAERHGLTYAQLVALRHVARCGPLAMSDLTERVGCTRGAMTGLVDRLEEAGLVSRRPSAEDRRVIFLDLTPRGSEVLAQVQASWSELTRRWLSRLDLGGRARVSQALGSLLEVEPQID